MVEAFCRKIEAISEWTGKTVSWLFIPFMILVVIDVTTRLLRNPWFFIDINIQISGTLIILGMAYCYLHDGHIGVDVLVTNFSQRKRAILNLALFPLFLVGFGVMLWMLGIAAWDSASVSARHTGSLMLFIYPYKIMLVVGISLFILQGIVKAIRDLKVVFPAKSGGQS